MVHDKCASGDSKKIKGRAFQQDGDYLCNDGARFLFGLTETLELIRSREGAQYFLLLASKTHEQ